MSLDGLAHQERLAGLVHQASVERLDGQALQVSVDTQASADGQALQVSVDTQVSADGLAQVVSADGLAQVVSVATRDSQVHLAIPASVALPASRALQVSLDGQVQAVKSAVQQVVFTIRKIALHLTSQDIRSRRLLHQPMLKVISL